MKINVTVKCLILGMLIPLFMTAGINAQVIEAPDSIAQLQLFPYSFNMDDTDIDWNGYTFHPFDGSELERIPNPDKTGLNDTDYVLKYVKAREKAWAGFFYDLKDSLIVNENTVFRMKVWSNIANVTALLKLEMKEFAQDVNTGDLKVNVTAAGEWLHLEWNLSEFDVDDNTPWDRVVIIMDIEGGAGTGGDRYTWYLDDFVIEDGTTSIDQISSDIPQDLQLKQNYPNPFNPTTTIEFGLADASFTTLEVYNMLGQRMAVLANEQLAAGWHRVNLDATNLSSGTYIYRLQAGDRVETRKLTLIK